MTGIPQPTVPPDNPSRPPSGEPPAGPPGYPPGYPAITVLTSVFNAENFLPPLLESVLRQSFPDFEWIIVNDGSTDQSLTILEDYARRDPRIRLFDQPNRGICASVNRGLTLSRGRFIARLDADDICFPNRLERQLHVMEANPDLVILGAGAITMTADGQPNAIIIPPLSDTAIRMAILFDNPFIQSAVMLRTAVLRDYKLAYNPALIDSEDYDLFARLLPYGKAANLSEPLILRRIHSLQKGEIRRQESILEADRISRRSLLLQGLELSLEEVQMLRGWYRDFPLIQDDKQIHLAACMFDLLESLASHPGLDPQELRWVRARWILRFLLARPRGWSTISRVGRFIRRIHVSDLPLLVAYLFYRRAYLASLKLSRGDRLWAHQIAEGGLS